MFGSAQSVFRPVSNEELIAIVPHKTFNSKFTVIAPQGRSTSPLPFVVSNDPRIPGEVSYKAGYVNATRPPENFTSARLWGIAIADSRVPGYESAEVEVASTSLSCRIEGKDIVLNDDAGTLSGGLYQRIPWFSTDSHDPIPLAYDLPHHSVVLRVGQRVDRIWHFWSPSPRAALPAGTLEGCTVHAQVRISSGALLQMGMDYWRSPTVPYGAGGNNREAGASNWYFSSSQWQDASFTDIGGPAVLRNGLNRTVARPVTLQNEKLEPRRKNTKESPQSKPS